LAVVKEPPLSELKVEVGTDMADCTAGYMADCCMAGYTVGYSAGCTAGCSVATGLKADCYKVDYMVDYKAAATDTEVWMTTLG
jgi:hypothetical protein